MELIAKKRENFGKKTKSLRESGVIPAVISGKKVGSLSVEMDYDTFKKAFSKAGETDIIDLKIDGHTHKVLVKNVQFNPVSGKISHVEFYAPDLTVKIEAQIPVEVVGEDDNDLIKSGQAMLFYVVDEITVKALPTDLPHAFVIDVTSIANVGDSVTVGQLEYDKEKVEIVDLEEGDDVIRLDKVEEQVEEEETAVSEEEAIAGVEALAEKKPEEGEEDEEAAGKDKEKGGKEKK